MAYELYLSKIVIKKKEKKVKEEGPFPGPTYQKYTENKLNESKEYTGDSLLLGMCHCVLAQ